MPITFECSCGRKLRTSEENAGRSATCPDCRTRLIVPAAEAVAAPPPVPRRPAPAAPNDFPAEEVVPVPPRPADPYNRPPRNNPYARNDDSARRGPYDGRDHDVRRSFVRPPPASNPWTEGGVLKGLGMMVLGVLITVGGLAIGWLIFPGPILFIYGLVSLVRGAASGKM